jgi:hypothetical protein
MRRLFNGFIPSFASLPGKEIGGMSLSTVVAWGGYCEVAMEVRVSFLTGIL